MELKFKIFKAFKKSIEKFFEKMQKCPGAVFEVTTTAVRSSPQI